LKKNLVVATLFAILLISVPIRADGDTDSAVSGTAFKDVKDSHWAKAQIARAVEQGYVSGFPDGTFKPDQKVSRAEFIRMLVDALKLPHVEQGKPWYQPYAASLLEAGIHRADEFKTGFDQPLTRLEMVRLAVRSTDEELKGAGAKASDKQLMYAATVKGILHGMGKGELAPDGTSTRAQAVAVIERVLALNSGKTLPADKNAIQHAAVEWKGNNIEEMWGAKPYDLPLKLDITKNLDITLDQVIVVDYDDPHSAYWDWFKHAVKENRKPIKDEYVVAFHFKIKNTILQKGLRNWLIGFTISGPIGTVRTVVTEDYYDQTPIHVIPFVERDSTKVYEGWYAISMPKLMVEEKIKNYLPIDLHLLRFSDQKHFDIIPQS